MSTAIHKAVGMTIDIMLEKTKEAAIAEYRFCRQAQTTAVLSAWRLGQHLCSIRDHAERGTFLPFLEANGIEQQFSSRCMRLFKQRPDLPSEIESTAAAVLSLPVMFELLGAPKEVVSEVEERAKSGEQVGRDEVRRLKAELAEEKRLKEAFQAESNARRIKIRDLESSKVVVETVTDNAAAEKRYLDEIAKLKQEQKEAHEAHLKVVEDVRNRVKGALERDAEQLQERIIVRQRALDALNAKVANFQKLTQDTVVQNEALKKVEQHLISVVADSYPLTDTDYALSADDARRWIKLIDQHLQWLGGLKMTAEHRLSEGAEPKLIEQE